MCYLIKATVNMRQNNEMRQERDLGSLMRFIITLSRKANQPKNFWSNQNGLNVISKMFPGASHISNEIAGSLGTGWNVFF